MTKEQATILEQEHNVIINPETEQVTLGERGDVFGWSPVPQEWIDSIQGE